ncbi:chromosome partitioning protein ParB, partial [Halomonas sp. BBD48]|nr:chromosome partitioning protein ParB [Halomonas sp. BBD48]
MTRKRALGRGLDALIGAGARRRELLDADGQLDSATLAEGASVVED